ncbi:MAG: hypothetical protein ACT4PU_02220 [Planctomycetota bacterium]
MRLLGPLLILLVLAALAGLRWFEHGQAVRLLQGEARARSTLWALQEANQAAAALGHQPPGLDPAWLAALAPETRLAPRTELAGGAITFATDDAYLYGFVRRSVHDPETGAERPGFVLRAWPERFGVTGDAEFQITEEGLLWQAQNRHGRSGVKLGFPPAFPEPDLTNPRSAWRPVERSTAAAHK